MDLVAWLRAQLDEDERVAKAVTPMDWLDEDGWIELAPEVAEHARHHDPARVLREVAAKRRIIDAHPRLDYRRPHDDDCCETCSRPSNTDDRLGEWPCQTLKLLALPYRDRPGWREEWTL